MKTLKNPISLRGDMLYCPLPLSVDAYGNCLTNCHHCYFRNLNHIWGQDLKPANVLNLSKKLRNGLKNPNPISPMAYALSKKKTIRFGNKTDPFQKAELKYRVSRNIIALFNRLKWTYIIQTRFTHIMMEYYDMFLRSPELVTIMPVLSPGLDKDWEIFEKKETTPPEHRLRIFPEFFKKCQINFGVNGEPFIPGYHTEKDFEQALLLLKKHGIKSYNTYNFHFNAFVAKRLNAIGIDIEKIWHYNQDSQWNKILPKLLALGDKHGIKVGCPDFVNSGWERIEPANTCCGIDVPNPCTFNTHYFKKYKQLGKENSSILNDSWDGVGTYNEGESIVLGTCNKMYNLNDII